MAHAGYLGKLFATDNEFYETVERTLKDLTEIQDQFDSIAFRGLSGSLMAPIICYHLKKNMVAVRKGEKTHSSLKVECRNDNQIGRYIILDDQVSGGGTVGEILTQLGVPSMVGTCVGVYTYSQICSKGSFTYGSKLKRLGRFS